MVLVPYEVVQIIIEAGYTQMMQYRQLRGYVKYVHSSPETIHDAYISRRAHFASLCLVSRSFHGIAQPLLYKVFHDTESGCGWMLRLDRFMRTLIDRPDLAAQVNDISMELLYHPARVDYPFTRDVPSLLKKFFATLRRRLPGRVMDNDYHDITGNRQVLLLSLCENLATFRLTCTKVFVKYHRLADLVTAPEVEAVNANSTIRSDQANTAQLLRNLQHFSCHFIEDFKCEQIGIFESYFRLPRMSNIVLENFHLARPSNVRVQYSSLRVFRVIDSTWSTAGVEYLLEQSPCLQVLELKHTACASTREEDLDSDLLDVDFDDLGEVLRTYGSSLIDLTIDPRGVSTYNNTDNEDYLALLGDLKPLDQLRSLSCPLIQLLDLPHADDYFDQAAQSDHYSRAILSTRLAEEILPDSIKYVTLLDHNGSSSPICLEYPERL